MFFKTLIFHIGATNCELDIFGSLPTIAQNTEFHLVSLCVNFVDICKKRYKKTQTKAIKK